MQEISCYGFLYLYFMKYMLLFVSVFPFSLLAQSSELRFSLVDESGHKLTENTCTVSISEYAPIKQDGRDLKEEYNVFFSPKDTAWYLRQADPVFSNLTISIKRKADNGMMYIHYPAWDPEHQKGCQYCMIRNIPFRTGAFRVDMPTQPASWNLIPAANIPTGDVLMNYKDLTLIQNWSNQMVKQMK